MDKWIETLVAFFLNVKGASMATLLTETIPCVNKGRGANSFISVFGNRTILKIATRYVGIGHRYALAVNNRVDKEVGEHEEVHPQPRVWGERIGNSVLFTHTKKGETPETYLEYFYLNANSQKSTHIYVWADNREPLTKSEFVFAKSQFNLDPPKKISSTQSDAGLTEENAVLVNQIMLKNLVEVHAYGSVLTR